MDESGGGCLDEANFPETEVKHSAGPSSGMETEKGGGGGEMGFFSDYSAFSSAWHRHRRLLGGRPWDAEREGGSGERRGRIDTVERTPSCHMFYF